MMHCSSKIRCDLVGATKQCDAMWSEVTTTPSIDRCGSRVDVNGVLWTLSSNALTSNMLCIDVKNKTEVRWQWDVPNVIDLNGWWHREASAVRQ